MHELQLVAPAPEHASDAGDFAAEVFRADGDGIHGSCGLNDAASYSHWRDTITRSAAGESFEHLSPSSTYFAVRHSDGAIVGICNIRYALDSEFMQTYRGHIGYTVRPSERRKGCGTHMLRLALDRCRELNILRVLVTCDPQNTASCRTIEVCGGTMEDEIPFPGTDELVRRYWINLT